MNKLQSIQDNEIRAAWLAVALASLSSLAYLLIAWNILGVGDLNMTTDAPPLIV